MLALDGTKPMAGVLFVMFTVVHAASADTLIDLSAPYNGGEAWFQVGGNGQFDTIAFAGIGSAVLQSLSNRIPEDLSLYGFLSFDTTQPAVAGYRFHSDIGECDSFFCGGGYVGNPDTVWEEATHFPDSLHELDLIRVDGYWRGRWCYANYLSSEDYRGCTWAFVQPNLPAIIYMRGNNGRSVKLQAAECFVESSYVKWSADDSCLNSSVTSILIRWAADSAGNGVFRHGDAAIGPPRSAPGTAWSTAKQREGQVPFSRPYFDLRGRPMAHPSSGVYITPEGRALMIRRRDALW